jgi:c-di-AMP phosphodiesterase-like protein
MKIVEQYQKINKCIDESSSVFIVGHADLDLDALGASLAMYSYVEGKNKETYFVLDDRRNEAAVSKVIKELRDEVRFINSNKALTIKNADSLLIVMDTNKEYLVPDSALLGNFDSIIVIDHHEQGEGTVNRAKLLIVDTEASSTCEMMTEFLKLNKFTIDSYLATILLSGIILDTNNYVLKTDTNTFYYSYFLTTCGAEPKKVQFLLKQDLNKYIKRQKMITNVKMVNKIAITKGNNNEIYRREEIAKAADTLLLFNNVEASFVIARLDKNTIGISGRSLGNLNVGQILGMLGGGGDANEAAAKIPNKTTNNVENDVLNIIKLL